MQLLGGSFPWRMTSIDSYRPYCLPVLAVVLTAVCTHMALWRTCELIEPERSFALVYFVQDVFNTLHRIMQVKFGKYLATRFSQASQVYLKLQPLVFEIKYGHQLSNF